MGIRRPSLPGCTRSPKSQHQPHATAGGGLSRNTFWLIQALSRWATEGPPAGGPLFCSRRLARLHPHEFGEQRIEARAVAGVEVDAADLLDQTLERFELLEAQEQRVVLHQLRRVEQRTGGRGLLLAADQVGLGGA